MAPLRLALLLLAPGAAEALSGYEVGPGGAKAYRPERIVRSRFQAGRGDGALLEEYGPETDDNGTLPELPEAGKAPAASTEAAEKGRLEFLVAPPAGINTVIVVPTIAPKGGLMQDGANTASWGTPAPIIVEPPEGDNVVVVMPDAPGGEKKQEPAGLAEQDGVHGAHGKPTLSPPIVVVPAPGKNVVIVAPNNQHNVTGSLSESTSPRGGPTPPPFVVAPPLGENLIIVMKEKMDH